MSNRGKEPEALSYIDGDLFGEAAQSFESELEDVQSAHSKPDQRSASASPNKEVKFEIKETDHGEQRVASSAFRQSQLRELEGDLSASKLAKLRQKVSGNQIKLQDMRLLELLKMQKNKATASRELDEKRRAAILKQCVMLESMIKSQVHPNEIESWLGDD